MLTTSDVAVVILNYNGAALLRQFLPSVIANSGKAQIIVIDNASTDGSQTLIRQEFPSVEVVSLDLNYGFCGGYNRGMKSVSRPISILLNSDVEVTSGWLDPLLKAFGDLKIAAVQPKVLSYRNKQLFEYAGAAGGFLDKLGFPYCRGRILNTLEADKGQYNDTIEIDWATGACMAIRTELYKKHGGLDEAFFAHMEEIDLCWRLRNQGYQILCSPESVVYHVGGATLGYESPRKVFLNHRNNLLMIYKNMEGWKCFLTLWLRLNLDGLIGLSYLFSRGWQGTWAVIKAHYSFYSLIPKMESFSIRVVSRKKRPAWILWHFYVHGRKTYSELPDKVRG